jgi:hypothetical protein
LRTQLYIPGFSGSLHCPDATQFCALETITGVFYPEQNILYEVWHVVELLPELVPRSYLQCALSFFLSLVQYIFWGIILAICLFFFFGCAMPCFRDRLIDCSKGCCGVRQFEDEFLDADEIKV